MEVTVHIKHTVTTNATFSAHASTWFLESGVYTTGETVIGSFTAKQTQEKNALLESIRSIGAKKNKVGLRHLKW